MDLTKFTSILFVVVLSIAVANSQSTYEEVGNVIGQAMQFVAQCGGKEISVCLKERALKYLDGTTGNIEIVEGVTLKETNSDEDEVEKVSEVSLPEEARARENAIDGLLMNRISRFLTSHTLEFKLPKSSIAEMKRNMDVEEGRRKRRRMLLPLLILMKLKAAIFLPLFIGAVAVIAIKALIAGKVALVVTGLVALKKLLESKESSQSYEVVAHPHHTHSHISSYDDHHHGHFRRALTEDPHSIPYSAYIKNKDLFGNQ